MILVIVVLLNCLIPAFYFKAALPQIHTDSAENTYGLTDCEIHEQFVPESCQRVLIMSSFPD